MERKFSSESIHFWWCYIIITTCYVSDPPTSPKQTKPTKHSLCRKKQYKPSMWTKEVRGTEVSPYQSSWHTFFFFFPMIWVLHKPLNILHALSMSIAHSKIKKLHKNIKNPNKNKQKQEPIHLSSERTGDWDQCFSNNAFQNKTKELTKTETNISLSTWRSHYIVMFFVKNYTVCF